MKRNDENLTVKLKYRIVFNRSNDSVKKLKLFQLEIYNPVRRNKVYVSLHMYAEEGQWDKHSRLVINHPNVDMMNNALYQQLIEIEALELDYIRRGVKYNIYTIKNDIKEHRKVKYNQTFNEFCNDQIEDNLETRSTSTTKNLRNTVSKLDTFKKKIDFQEVDEAFVKRFQKWLIDEKGSATNTVTKHLSHLRHFIRCAVDKGYLSEEENPFRGGKIKMTKVWTTEHKNLDKEELRKFEGYKANNQKDEKIVDQLLFSCYTGLRYSDIVTLTEDNIIEENGCKWIVKKQVKTKNDVKIPIGKLFDGKAVEIINKYGGKPERMSKGIRNQYGNTALKRISKELGVDKNVTYHSGRHTFSSMLTAQGLSPQYVAKLTGHASVETLKSYVTIENSDIIEQLDKLG